MLRVLDSPSEAQLAQARELLATLRDTLTTFGATADHQAVLAASIFHRRIHSIGEVKAAMAAAGLPVRQPSAAA